jgi:hypothetical protein
MNRLIRLAAIGALAFGIASPVAAQEAKDTPPAKADQQPTPPPEPPATPAPGATTMGEPGQPIPGSPNLSVATVRMEGGTRTSKIVGAAVFNASNQQVGSIDDLIFDHDDKVVLGVISVGGFLGVGGKLVAVPFASLHVDGTGKVTLPEANKEALNKMPGFTYNP